MKTRIATVIEAALMAVGVQAKTVVIGTPKMSGELDAATSKEA